jgi:hypothetical protein
MNKHVITSLSLAIVVAVVVSCQPHPKDGQNASTAPKDTVASQNIQPAESSYADVNGLKMYYEVYGKGKPIVLLHGPYMNIPLNWSHSHTPVCQRPESNCDGNARPRSHKGYTPGV